MKKKLVRLILAQIIGKYEHHFARGCKTFLITAWRESDEKSEIDEKCMDAIADRIHEIMNAGDFSEDKVIGFLAYLKMLELH